MLVIFILIIGIWLFAEVIAWQILGLLFALIKEWWWLILGITIFGFMNS